MLPDTRFSVPKKVVHELFEDELVIINLENGSYYTLTGPGAEIWGLIALGASSGEVVQRVSERYQGERSQLESAVGPFMAELQQEGLIAPGQSEAASSAGHPEDALVPPSASAKRLFEAPILHKYSDMQALLVLDPIHEVDEMGWPSARARPA